MNLPGDADWKVATETARPFADVHRAAFSSPRIAEEFATAHWQATYLAGDALFLRSPSPILGKPTGYSSSGRPVYRPTFPPGEVWHVLGIAFQPLWSFAKSLGFMTPALSAGVVEECDEFLNGLALREPIGLWHVGQGVAVFRRIDESTRFALSDMRRASELNLAVLGEPQDVSHRPQSLARNFVQQGLFYLGY